MLFPQLAGVRQPLAGETAAPGAVLEKVGLADGYGVELALLVDVAAGTGSGRWPRWTSGCGSTATGRSRSCGPRRWTCCGPPWTGPGSPAPPPATAG